jgi:hypothetical protein
MNNILFTLLLALTCHTGRSQVTIHYDIYGDGATTLWKFPVDTLYHSCACRVLTSPTGSSGLAVSPALRIGNLRVMDHSIVIKDTVDIEMYNIFNATIPPYPLRVITRPAGYHIEVECDLGP